MTITTHGFPDPVTIAAQYLQARGLAIVDRSWQHARLDTGIVAADQHVLVVCYVTGRSAAEARPAAQPLTPDTLRQLRHHGEAWLTSHDPGASRVRVDMITVTYDGPGGYTIEHAKAVG